MTSVGMFHYSLLIKCLVTWLCYYYLIFRRIWCWCILYVLLMLLDTKIVCSYYLCLWTHDYYIIFHSISQVDYFVTKYLSRCAAVMYQSLAMTTEISNIGGRIN